MKELLSELYQVLGELNAPANVLDQVAAAAAGQPLPHATLLPFAADANPIGHTTGAMHGDVNGNTFFEVKLAGRRRLPFMGQSVYVGSPPAALPDGDLSDAVIQATAEAVGDAYDCMRVWSAWGVGTMGPDDFLPVADDGDRVAEIARAAIGAWLGDQAAIKDSLTADRQAVPVALEPVEGDLLPAVGDTVLIHLSRPDGWFPHRVVGYYAWGDRSGSKSLYRVFVRVVDAEGYTNARPLDAIRRLDKKAAADGCQGQGCRLERESPPTGKTGKTCETCKTCKTCNGHGMIGGLLPNGGGYDGEPCPDCSAPQATAEDSSVVQAEISAPATEYSWSSNGEEYHGRFGSVAEAVCSYLDSEGGDAEETVHVGEVKPYEPGKPIWLADNVLETLSDHAYGEIGEWVEDWPELPPEKREQLGKMIQDFVWKHDAPRFFSIGKSELVDVAPYRDDAAAQKGGA